MAMHGGDLLGYHAFDIILPDMDMGVYLAVNLGTSFWDRTLIALHILDVLAGEQRWLNATYICNNFHSSDDILEEDMVQEQVYSKPTDVKKHKQRGPMNSQIETYVGDYGHFGYGNITVRQEGETGNLTLRFGRTGVFELLPLEGDSFAAISVGESWHINLGLVEFSRSQEGQPIGQLVIPFVERLNPPVFKRGLKMSDAPSPRLDTC